jgi:hypothetical protein
MGIDHPHIQEVGRFNLSEIFFSVMRRAVFPIMVLLGAGLPLYEIYVDWQEGYWDSAPNPFQWFLATQISLIATSLLVLRYFKQSKALVVVNIVLMVSGVASTVVGIRWFIEINTISNSSEDSTSGEGNGLIT